MELIYLKGLEDVSKGFPMEKMEDVLENEEKYTEELLEVLDYTIKNAEELCKDEKYIIHVFAMYILAYFGEERAYPAVVAIAKLPSSIIDPLLEDVITEGLASIIMSVYDGNPEPIKEIVECSECNLFVRWAAVESLLALAANGMMDEDEVICYIKGLFNHKLRRIDKNISDAPVQDSSDIDPQESEEEMMDNCEDIFFEYFVQDINALLKKQISKEEVRGDRACRYITKSDVFNLSDWYGFSGEAYKSLSIVGYGEDDFSFNDVKVIPFKNVEKTGQNDPCPCGSGKKYKECCGKQENK